MTDYKCVLTSLASILKVPDKQIPVITETVVTVNKLITRALLFLKLYLLHSPEEVKVTQKMVDTIILRIGTRRDQRVLRANQALYDKLTPIYEEHFLPLVPEDDEPLLMTNLDQILKYASKRVVTDYKTNITGHFPKYVQDYVDHYYSKWDQLKDPKTDRTGLTRFLEKIRDDVMIVRKFPGDKQWKSKPEYFADIRKLQALVLPPGPYRQDDLLYDRKVRPQAYLKAMMFVTQTCRDNDPKYKLRRVVPLRTSPIPAYIRFDTSAVIHLLMPVKGRSKLHRMTIAENSPIVWPSLFRMDKEVFRKPGYSFAFKFETDGVGASLLFKKDGTSEDEADEGVNTQDGNEPLIDKLSPDRKLALKSKTIIGNDPGMSDLLSFVSENSTGHNPQKLRYTQAQRELETRNRKYRGIIQQLKDTTRISGKTVAEWEEWLAQKTPRGCNDLDHEEYSIYLENKLLFNQVVGPFYEDRLFRKLRFNAYINTQRSEQQLVNRFQDKFGTPDEVMIGYGNWSETHHRKHHAPVKGVGFRKLFRKAGYEVVLVDENRTSHYCSSCQIPTAYCKEVKLPPGSKSVVNWHGRVHGLLRCTTCKSRWNRDVNGAINIAKAARAALQGEERPVYLQKGQWHPPRPHKTFSVVGGPVLQVTTLMSELQVPIIVVT
jgi:hypothetical protein